MPATSTFQTAPAASHPNRQATGLKTIATVIREQRRAGFGEGHPVALPPGRTRRAGGGRKPLIRLDRTFLWDVADVYGVLANLDHTQDFLKAIAAKDGVAIAYIVTDEERLFESVAQELPDRIEPVRLYEAYLRNFEIESGRGSL